MIRKVILCQELSYKRYSFLSVFVSREYLSYIGATRRIIFVVINCCSNLYLPQVWKAAPTPPNDKYQYTYFAHKINSFDTAPKKLLPSDSRLRPDRYALEKGDMSKSGAQKST